MMIDAKHAKWARGAAAAGAFLALVYAISARLSLGSSAESAIRISFGLAGFGIFVFECLLTLRKRYRASLAGRLQTWLRAHIWLGLLSFLLVLMHSGFRWGSGLAAVLMWLLSIVVVSGMSGVAFQHYLPRLMKELVEKETVVQQIPNVIGKLRTDADRARRLNGVLMGADAKQILDSRFEYAIGPYLQEHPPASSMKTFGSRKSIEDYFGDWCRAMPPAAQTTLKTLEDICEERRQLAVQRKLHGLLHSWLLVHVPLSFGLLGLTAIHAVLALRY